MPPNRFESEVESFLEGSHGDRTHIKRADHPRLHHYAGHYYPHRHPPSEGTPWLAGRGLTTHGSHALQTSSNWSILKPSVRTRVTNVVNLRPKTKIFRKNAVGLTTFVTSAGKAEQKAARIDDVCNNTR